MSYPFTYSLPNEYIPSNFTVLPLGIKALPSLAYKTDQLNVFYKQGHKFR